jgi:hypothetical protein
MRYIKYLKILTFCLFSLTLSFIQCNKETGFQPYPCIKGQVYNLVHLGDSSIKVPIDSAKVRVWINGLQLDTLTYFTDSEGIYSTDRINNWFNKSITIEASRIYGKYNNPDGYVPAWSFLNPDGQNADSVTSDTLYKGIEVKKLYAERYTVLPKRLDFPVESQYSSYFIILNESSSPLYWEIGENNTEWMSFYWTTIYNASDFSHLKKWGYVKFRINIITTLLTPGIYDSSILVITNLGNTIIPIHVVVK